MEVTFRMTIFMLETSVLICQADVVLIVAKYFFVETGVDMANKKLCHYMVGGERGGEGASK